jgi:hypothetical protein
VRGDYDVATIPVLDGDSVGWVKMERASWSEVKNVVKVTYTDRALFFTPRVVQIQNLATLQMAGRQELTEDQFDALSNEPAARIAAERLLRTVGYPLAIVNLGDVHGVARNLRPGSVFKLVWPDAGISGMVLRATRVRGGEVRDGAIEITAIEDAYGIDGSTFGSSADSTFAPFV